jgi:hypothetical protein
MSTSHIIALLIEERDHIQAAITALHGAPAPKTDNVPDWVLPIAKPAKKKRKVSAAARKRMAEGQRKRWEAKRATVVAESVSPTRKTNSVRIAEAIAPPAEDVEFKSKMSAAMKASWAKRKKAAAKKNRA